MINITLDNLTLLNPLTKSFNPVYIPDIIKVPSLKPVALVGKTRPSGSLVVTPISIEPLHELICKKKIKDKRDKLTLCKIMKQYQHLYSLHI